MRYWNWQFTCNVCGHRSKWFAYDWLAKIASRWHFIFNWDSHTKKFSIISAKGISGNE